MQDSQLFGKVYGAMLGGAIGDAMGGPVEGWDYRRIDAEHPHLEEFLPYAHQPSFHTSFGISPAVYTDDTRLKHILCHAIIARGDIPRRGDFARACADYYYGHTDDLHRGFIEEYMLAGLYGEDKLIFGGQPTNAAIMMNSPLGLICPCDPRAALAAAYNLAYITDGYAKHSAALMAAAVAAAMAPEATTDSVIADMLSAAEDHRAEGELSRSWDGYRAVCRPNETLVEKAVEIAARKRDVFAVREEFMAALRYGPIFSDAAETLAVAIGMFYAAGGDPELTIVGGVNYGRDNDSYASVGGALAGSFRGAGAIPGRWKQEIQAANPEPDMYALSRQLTAVALSRYERQRQVVSAVARLASPAEDPARHPH